MSIEILVIYVLIRHLATILVALHLSRVLYKSTLFMQNKPNLLNALMNVNTVLTKDYENKRLRRCVKTKPIQSQYKAKTNPIPEMPKMKLNSYSTKDYENKPPSSPKKTNPIQTQSNPTCRGVASGEAGSNYGLQTVFTGRPRSEIYTHPECRY